MLRHLSLLVLTPLSFGLALALPATAAPDLPVGTCMASSTDGQITCDLRAVVPATLDKLERVNSAMQGESLVVTPFEGTAAWLMLVDTTHQAPVGLITDDRYGGIRADLNDMIALSNDSRLVEVQAYDGTLQTLAPFGADASVAATALEGLQAVQVDPQDRSGLYLSALSAVERLAELEADRKALVLFTDGLQNASDSSVNRLIDAAEAAGVTIIGMAYAGGEADLANHLDLREMAAQTQGTTLYPSMTNQRLSDDNLRGFFATLENGGTLELSMDDSSIDSVRLRALYSDGRTMDGELSLPSQ
ncbi:MAG: hypothetical protein RIC24_14580 [Hyphomicrobiales bacterium]|jgi:hypothetical protein